MTILQPTEPPVTTNRFRNAMGQQLMRSLFFETAGMDKTHVQYTLKDYDNNGLPSLYLLYMASDDLTEYSFAVNHLDGWLHWEKLCKAGWFKPYITEWRRELEIRTRSRALASIKEVAASGGKEAYQAQKFLVTNGWMPESKRRGAGRPSKESIAQEAERIAREAGDTNEDLERLQGYMN